MSVDAQETGKYIRQYRKVAGLTQEELAQKVGISTMSIRRYESGERIASRDMLHAIATALNVDFYSLASWDQATKALEDDINAGINARARLDAAYEKLNDVGQEKAAEAVEIIAGNPDYQRAKSTPPAREGKDTTPPADGLKTDFEGE